MTMTDEMRAAFEAWKEPRRANPNPYYVDEIDAVLDEHRDAWCAAWNAALEAASGVCDAERLDDPQDETDAAYDRAIEHVQLGIRTLKGSAP